ncbi:PREDICTED: uncharacterized protein At3g43530-like [Brassica oleracea var. oleracea]|uniref:uncharacterized protein At3g43530-like n=1 Tax=Brassica oleracea var. oleracea TaxID=109376 RepID=UPI0006A6B45B|nr:PREDICTED: uncharacterized protein At3g43530-like [Brassica oleracea var. oleracea]
MKGYPLEDLYDTLGEIKVIESVLVPTVDEEPLMARLMDGEPDYENEEGVSNLWSTWLTVKEKPIFWQELYELDVAAREFPQKKDKRKVHEEASSSNTSLEDVLKEFEERLMTSLSEVNGKVEKMNKRLGKIERCQVVLKKRCKRMKSACGDRLKMAVLYFLGMIIRAKGRYNAPFDHFILRIVNDVEVCKTFPWGLRRTMTVSTIKAWIMTAVDSRKNSNGADAVMKHLKGKPKNNVNFPGFIIPLEILAFECIPPLKARFREGVEGCMSKCPRMCKKRFQSNNMKGYPLEDLYDTLGEIKVIESVLVPTVDEEPLMARLMDGEPDYENEEGVSNLWSTWLTVKEKPIFCGGKSTSTFKILMQTSASPSPAPASSPSVSSSSSTRFSG